MWRRELLRASYWAQPRKREMRKSRSLGRSRTGISFWIRERDRKSLRHEGIPVQLERGGRCPRSLQLGAALQYEQMGVAQKNKERRGLARAQPNQLRRVADLWILIENLHVHSFRPPLAWVAVQKLDPRDEESRCPAHRFQFHSRQTSRPEPARRLCRHGDDW